MHLTEIQVTQFRAMVAELLRQCDEQHRVAQSSGETWLMEDTAMAIRNLSLIDEQIREHSLPPSKGMSLGLSKAIGEWGIASLYELAGRIDDYYSRVWN